MFTYKDGSWIIPNFSSSLCPTHQLKFARAHTFPYSRAVSEFLRRNPEFFRKEHQHLHKQRTVPHGVPKLNNAPPPSCDSPGVAGSVLWGEAPVLHPQEGQGVKLLLISVNTTWCFEKAREEGTEFSPALRKCDGWDGSCPSCPAQIPKRN